MVRDLHYVKDSKSLPKVVPKSDGVLKHSGKHSSQSCYPFLFFLPCWFPRTLSSSSLASLNKRRDFGTDRWFDLLDKPEEWRDYRESKQNGSVTKLFQVVSTFAKVVPFFFLLNASVSVGTSETP